MIVSRELVFSNDLCSAFLTAIVKAFEGCHPKAYLGRTALQKLTYFAKVVGVPVPCSFGIYTYGPYSDTVTFAVESLLADDVITDTSGTPKYSNYRPGPNADELLDAFASELSPYEGKIKQTVKALGSFSPGDLELIATLHFIAQRQARITGGKPARDSVFREFRAIKHDKFPDQEIRRWYDALVRAGLIVRNLPQQQ
jgi:uncharacterized protein